MKNLSDIHDKFGGYKIQKPEFLSGLSLIGFGVIFLSIIMVLCVLLSEKISLKPESVAVFTYVF